MSACLSVYLSVHVFVCLSVCLSVYLCASVCRCIYLSVCPCICLSVRVSVCLYMYLSVRVSVCLSVYVKSLLHYLNLNSLSITHFCHIFFHILFFYPPLRPFHSSSISFSSFFSLFQLLIFVLILWKSKNQNKILKP